MHLRVEKRAVLIGQHAAGWFRNQAIKKALLILALHMQKIGSQKKKKTFESHDPELARSILIQVLRAPSTYCTCMRASVVRFKKITLTVIKLAYDGFLTPVIIDLV